MKARIFKILLLLALVLNPVAVLAQKIDDLNATHDPVATESPCQHEQLTKHELPESGTPAADGRCDLPCCADLPCFDQGDCVLHFSSAILLRNPADIPLPGPDRHGADTAQSVPEFYIPPDNPPPIHG